MNLRPVSVLLLAVALAPAVPARAGNPTPRELYTRALERERVLRDADQNPTIQQLRSVVNAYDSLVRQFPASGYSDNALWQAGNLALLAYERFGQAPDKRNAARFLKLLKEQYPTSSLAPRVDDVLQAAEALQPAAPMAPPSRLQRSMPAPNAAIPTTIAPPDQPSPTAPALRGNTTKADAGSGTEESAAGHKDGPADGRKDDAGTPGAPNLIRDITRTPLPDGTRVTIAMDSESNFRAERLENPRRVFFDLKGTRAVTALQDATIKFTEDVVREVRLGRHPQNTTRIVFDMEGVDGYSVFMLYNPFRLVIDFKAAGAAKPVVPALGSTPPPVALVASLPASPMTPPVVTSA